VDAPGGPGGSRHGMTTTSDHDPAVFTTSTSSPANHNQPDKPPNRRTWIHDRPSRQLGLGTPWKRATCLSALPSNRCRPAQGSSTRASKGQQREPAKGRKCCSKQPRRRAEEILGTRTRLPTSVLVGCHIPRPRTVMAMTNQPADGPRHPCQVVRRVLVGSSSHDVSHPGHWRHRSPRTTGRPAACSCRLRDPGAHPARPPGSRRRPVPRGDLRTGEGVDAAAVETAGGGPPTMNMAMARPGRRLSEGRNSVDGMSVDLLGRHERP
jgi:hypothetical protein